MPTKRSGTLGLTAIGLKLFTVVLKLLKSVKILLALGTFGAYSFMWSWKFALLVMFGIGVHESGHVWAMRRKGLRTKGFYFVPLLGGMSISEDSMGPHETYVALMGPAFGIVTVFVPMVMLLMTGSHFWSACASWLAFVNLFNLFPVNPLDGGRVVKCIALALHKWIGYAFLFIGFIVTIYAALHFKMGLLWYIAVIGMLEIDAMRVVFFMIPFVTILCPLFLLAALIREGRIGFLELYFVLLDHSKESFTRMVKRSREAQVAPLTKREIGKYSAGYVGMIALFLAVILILTGPGSDLTKEILSY